MFLINTELFPRHTVDCYQCLVVHKIDLLGFSLLNNFTKGFHSINLAGNRASLEVNCAELLKTQVFQHMHVLRRVRSRLTVHTFIWRCDVDKLIYVATRR